MKGGKGKKSKNNKKKKGGVKLEKSQRLSKVRGAASPPKKKHKSKKGK